MSVEDVTVKERSQSQDNYCVIPLPRSIEGIKITETESRMVVVRGWGGEGEMRNSCLMGRVSFLHDEEFWRSTVGMVAQHECV